MGIKIVKAGNEKNLDYTKDAEPKKATKQTTKSKEKK